MSPSTPCIFSAQPCFEFEAPNLMPYRCQQSLRQTDVVTHANTTTWMPCLPSNPPGKFVHKGDEAAADFCAPGSDDLWKPAVARVSGEQKACLDFERLDKLGIVAELLQLTDDAKQRCVGKVWRLRRGSGETVILRDVLGKVARWIYRFKDIGDVAVQYDPAHAALPWAGVRFLL